jgi:hypothetical protein
MHHFTVGQSRYHKMIEVVNVSGVFRFLLAAGEMVTSMAKWLARRSCIREVLCLPEGRHRGIEKDVGKVVLLNLFADSWLTFQTRRRERDRDGFLHEPWKLKCTHACTDAHAHTETHLQMDANVHTHAYTHMNRPTGTVISCFISVFFKNVNGGSIYVTCRTLS